MKHIKTFENFIYEATNKIVTKQDWDNADEQSVNEDLKSSLIGLLVLGSLAAGFNYLNHSAERKLKAGEPIEMSVTHSVFSDRPSAKDTYTIKVNNLQKEYVEVDSSTKTITINTSDISNIDLKRSVRDKIKDIDPDAATQSIKNIRIH